MYKPVAFRRRNDVQKISAVPNDETELPYKGIIYLDKYLGILLTKTLVSFC